LPGRYCGAHPDVLVTNSDSALKRGLKYCCKNSRVCRATAEGRSTKSGAVLGQRNTVGWLRGIINTTPNGRKAQRTAPHAKAGVRGRDATGPR
jgi:hypothetical protein